MIALSDLVSSVPDGSANESLLAFKVADELRIDAMDQLGRIFIFKEDLGDGLILLDQIRDADEISRHYQEQLASLVVRSN